MVNIPSEVKALFKSDVVEKNFHVHFPNGETADLNNEDIIAESVSFTESICSQQYFKFGLAESSEIEFTCVNVPNIKGATIQCAIEIDVTRINNFAASYPVDNTLDFLTPQTVQWDDGRYAYRVPYGEFIVDTCPRNHGAMYERLVTAYSEMPFNGSTIFYGENPLSKVRIRIEDYVNAVFLNKKDMEKQPACIPNTGVMIDACTSNGDTIQFSGVSATRNFYHVTDTTKVVAVRFEYTPHEFDNYAADMFKKAMSSFPNGSYTYEYKDEYPDTGSDVFQVYANNAQAMSVCTGQFAPCFWIKVQYRRPQVDVCHIVSKPIFVKPNKTYLLDFRKMEKDFLFINKLGSTYSMLEAVYIYTNVPWAWDDTARWRPISSPGVVVSNWPIADKFDEGEHVKYREETHEPPYVYFAEMESDETYPRIPVKQTGKIKKQGLLNYYTFDEAIDEYEMVTGQLEINGQFGRMGRNGKFERFALDNTVVTPIGADTWEEFWWDENEISPIGQVDITFDNSVETITKSITIGDGRSLYDMTDNSIFSAALMTEDRVDSIINDLFAPHAGAVQYSAVDLEMKGLPYLEAGDYIRMTSKDGETVDTVILEQTIRGVQDLRASVTSTNGELEGIVDE